MTQVINKKYDTGYIHVPKVIFLLKCFLLELIILTDISKKIGQRLSASIFWLHTEAHRISDPVSLFKYYTVVSYKSSITAVAMTNYCDRKYLQH